MECFRVVKIESTFAVVALILPRFWLQCVESRLLLGSKENRGTQNDAMTKGRRILLVCKMVLLVWVRHMSYGRI
jgi:hypothetical protein